MCLNKFDYDNRITASELETAGCARSMPSSCMKQCFLDQMIPNNIKFDFDNRITVSGPSTAGRARSMRSSSERCRLAVNQGDAAGALYGRPCFNADARSSSSLACFSFRHSPCIFSASASNESSSSSAVSCAVILVYKIKSTHHRMLQSCLYTLFAIIKK